jgi:hypothetical protein
VRHAAPLALAVLSGLLVLPAGTARERPVVALSASPARVLVEPGRRQVIALRNVASTTTAVSARAGGLTLDLRGRPRLVVRSPASSWLKLSPRELVVRGGGSAELSVEPRVPQGVEPGHHHAVVLLATRATRADGVAVRMRIGVRVVVQVPGRVVRRLLVRSLRVRRAGRARVLEVALANRGNVTESLPRGRVVVTLRVRGRTLVRLVARRRELLPHSRALLAVTYAGRFRGVARATVAVHGRPVRSFEIRV